MILYWIQKAIAFAAFIALAAMGELLTEKSGGLNLGTPGTMCVGAAAGFIAAFRYCSAVENPSFIMILLLTLLTAFAASALMGLIYSFFTVTMRINQNVVGLVLTILGCGLAEFLSIFFIKSESGNVRCDSANTVFTARIPFLSEKLGVVSDLLFGYGFMLYFTIALAIILTIVFNKSRVGLNLRAVGESPSTADAAGINVTRYKYVAACVGSGITGLAGVYCVMEFKSGAWATADLITIQAFGWLAVALVIFSFWKPLNLLWGSLIFGIFYWGYLYIPELLGVELSTDLTQMLPYIITIVVLIIVSVRKKKENLGPASLGVTYFREER